MTASQFLLDRSDVTRESLKLVPETAGESADGIQFLWPVTRLQRLLKAFDNPQVRGSSL
jgi:hypothetical protein